MVLREQNAIMRKKSKNEKSVGLFILKMYLIQNQY